MHDPMREKEELLQKRVRGTIWVGLDRMAYCLGTTKIFDSDFFDQRHFDLVVNSLRDLIKGSIQVVTTYREGVPAGTSQRIHGSGGNYDKSVFVDKLDEVYHHLGLVSPGNIARVHFANVFRGRHRVYLGFAEETHCIDMKVDGIGEGTINGVMANTIHAYAGITFSVRK